MRTTLLLFTVLVGLARGQQPSPIDLGGGQTLELIRVEPGTFQQGSPADEAGRGSDETPRTVTLTQPFLIGKFPVTRGQFARYVQASGYRTEAERGTSGGFGWEGGKLVQKKQYTWRNPGFPQTDEHPVVVVDFNDAQSFCAWLSRQTGRRFTLPTEAQWEYAARAGSTAPSVGAEVAALAWHRANSPNGTQPVGQLRANAWGLHDMLGNTWEWCLDWYGPYPPGAARDPVQTNSALSDKPRRVLRGGAFSRPAEEMRPAKRFRNDPGSRNADNGFRVVTLDVAAPAPPPVQPERRPILQPDAPPPNLERSEPAPATAPIERIHEPGSPVQSSRGGGWRFLFVLVPIALVLYFLVRKVLRGLSSAGPLTTSSSGPSGGGVFQPGHPLRVRTVADGFWISGAMPRGTPLRARWMAGNAQQQREFAFEPGPEGQFVFTGTQPISVSVMVVGAATAAGLGGLLDPTLDATLDPPIPPPRRSPFRGNPPAY